MPSKTISTKLKTIIMKDLKTRFEIEPSEWVLYTPFVSRLAIKFNTDIWTIEQCLEPFILSKDIKIKLTDDPKDTITRLLISNKAFNRKQKELMEWEKEREKELQEAPKDEEETRDYIRSQKPIKEDED